MDKEKRLRTAVGIISGRITALNIHTDDYEALGYATYNFRHYGIPYWQDVLKTAEEVLFDALIAKASQAEEN